MNIHKKIRPALLIVLLASLACSTLTNLTGGSQQGPDIADTPINSLDNSASSEDVPDDQPATQSMQDGFVTAMGEAKVIKITEMNWEIDEDGYITFLGLVTNTGEFELSFVELNFTLRDESGIPVASDYTYSLLDVIPPGGSSPFTMYFFDIPYAPWESYEIIIDGELNDFFSPYLDYEIVSASLQEGDSGYEIAGEIQNTGLRNAEFTAIYAVVYNSSNEIIAADFTFSEAEVIAPGESSNFVLSILDTIGDVQPDHFELYIEGSAQQ
jgi:hypothetical protein